MNPPAAKLPRPHQSALVTHPGDPSGRVLVPSSRTANRVDNAQAPYRLPWVIMTWWHHDAPPSTCEDGVGCNTNQSEYGTAGVRVAIQITNAVTKQRLWSGRATARSSGKGPEGSYDSNF